jgi:fucose 4-O-acetylase-like acetyltransferase
MDADRGIGIILVVLGHVERGLVSAHIATTPVWRTLDFALYTFHMPLFFLLAGMNAPSRLKRGRGRYLSGKITTLIYPYFLWSIIQGVILVLMSSVTNGKAGFGDILQIGWRPMSQFWFLYVLFLVQCSVVVIGPRPAVLAALAAAAIVAAQFFALDSVPERYFHSLPFFIIGMLVARWADKPWPVKPATLLAPLWALFAVSVFLSFKVNHVDFDDVYSLPAAVFGIAGTSTAAILLRGHLLLFFVYLGQCSMTIYVMHIMAASGMRILLVQAHVPHVDWVYLGICTATGVGAPLVAHALLSRLHVLQYLGLSSGPWFRPPELGSSASVGRSAP